MGDQAVAHGVPPGPGDALTEEPIQGLGNAIPRKRPSVRTLSWGLPGMSKTPNFAIPPDSKDRDAHGHHKTRIPVQYDLSRPGCV